MESEVEKVSGRAIDKITGVFTIKPVRPSYLSTSFSKDHPGAIIFDRAVVSYAAERHPKTGLVITGLTDQEARELEQEMGFKPGALSPYNRLEPRERNSGEFSWATFFIKIPKEGLVIDTSRSAIEKLQYKVLAAGSRVALSTADLASENSRYDFIMSSAEVETKKIKDRTAIKRKAFSVLSTMSIAEQMEFLSVYDEGRHGVSKDSTPDFIEGAIGNIVDREPDKFLAMVENPYYQTMVFLRKCVKANLVYQQGPKYMLSAGGDLLGNTLLDAVTNLQSDDYQGIKLSLMSKLEAR